MNYLDALMVQTTALRKVMKEPARSEALGRSSFKYREFTYTDAKESAPSEWSLLSPLAALPPPPRLPPISTSSVRVPPAGRL